MEKLIGECVNMDFLGIVKYGIANVLSLLVELCCAILPTSPFETFLDYFSKFEYLPYINFFLPIDAFCAVFEAWLSCVLLWYVWQFVMDVISWVSGYGSGGTIPTVKGG